MARKQGEERLQSGEMGCIEPQQSARGAQFEEPQRTEHFSLQNGSGGSAQKREPSGEDLYQGNMVYLLNGQLRKLWAPMG